MKVTDKQKANLIPFVKGDKRINRKGVPPEAIAARRFVQQVGAEIVKAGDEELTRYYAMIRLMFNSRQPKDREMLLKLMGHMPKEEIDVSNSDGSLTAPPLPDEERLARMKQLAAVIAEEIKRDA
jgi:hypothetical protein